MLASAPAIKGFQGEERNPAWHSDIGEKKGPDKPGLFVERSAARGRATDQ